jgi:hypothetical protein
VGTIQATWCPRSITATAAISATSVLPQPTSPWSSLAQITKNLQQSSILGNGQLKGGQDCQAASEIGGEGNGDSSPAHPLLSREDERALQAIQLLQREPPVRGSPPLLEREILAPDGGKVDVPQRASSVLESHAPDRGGRQRIFHRCGKRGQSAVHEGAPGPGGKSGKASIDGDDSARVDSFDIDADHLELWILQEELSRSFLGEGRGSEEDQLRAAFQNLCQVGLVEPAGVEMACRVLQPGVDQGEAANPCPQQARLDDRGVHCRGDTGAQLGDGREPAAVLVAEG